jgi:hypothetical protein
VAVHVGFDMIPWTWSSHQVVLAQLSPVELFLTWDCIAADDLVQMAGAPMEAQVEVPVVGLDVSEE